MICSSSSKRGHDAVMSKLFIKALFVVLGSLTLSEVIITIIHIIHWIPKFSFSSLVGIFFTHWKWWLGCWDAKTMTETSGRRAKKPRQVFHRLLYRLLFIHCWPSERLRQFHRARIVHLLFTAYSWGQIVHMRILIVYEWWVQCWAVVLCGWC